MPPASPASTRLQYSASKYSGCLRKAADRLVPVSTSVRMSLSSRVMRGLVLPRPTMSNAWISGTPARIIVGELAREDRDVLLLDRLAAAHAALLHLVDQDALAAQAGADHGFAAGAHLAANDLAVLVLAFPLEDDVLDRLLLQLLQSPYVFEDRYRPSLAIAPCATRWSPRSLLRASSRPLTLSRPDWRRSRTPSRCACSAMSIARAVGQDDASGSRR